jgi:putative tryptophan/tyrosine transport system substrate-binding protein
MAVCGARAAAGDAGDRLVCGVSAAEWAEPMTGFRRGLSESGFVEGRNVTIDTTGVTLIAGELAPKRLELLHELLPTAKKIALLVNPKVPTILQDDIQGARTAARRFGLDIIVVKGGSEDEIERAFATASQQRASALQVGDDAFFESRRAQIAALGLRHALPTIALTRRAVAAGSLMSYGSNQADVYRQAGIYVGRILKGEKPADLPVLRPTKFELVINLKTAKALGVESPRRCSLALTR